MDKRKTLFGTVVAVVALVAVVFIVNQRTAPESDERTLRVGVILPLTGPSSFLGDFCKNGIDLAADHIRKDQESKLEVSLLYADSKNEPRTGVNVYNQLKLRNPAAVVVAMSSVTNAVAPVALSDGMPLFATMVSARGITDQYPNMFRLFVNADVDARLMAEFAAKTKGFAKVAIIAVNDDMGVSFTEVFRETFEGFGGKIVLSETFATDATNFRDAAEKTHQADPDAVYLLGYDRNLGQLARTLRERGINKPFLSTATISQAPVLEIAGESVSNTFFTSVRFDPANPASEVARKFVKDYTERYGQPPTYFSAFSYDSIMLLTKAAEAGMEPEQIFQGLKDIENFEGASGFVSFAGSRDARFPMVVNQIQNGSILPTE